MNAGLFRIVATPPGGTARVIQKHKTAEERDASFGRLSRGKGWSYAPVDAAPCACRHYFTCGGREDCGLDMLECIEQHYVAECAHVWNGGHVDIGNGSSSTCSECGMLAIGHDMLNGP